MTESTGLATLADYERRGGFNVLHPTAIAEEADTSPMLKQTASIVKLQAGSLDTYNDFLFANERKGDFALSGYALQRIATAAGIQFHPELSGPVRDGCIDFPDGHRRYTYRAVGGVRQPNGEPIWLTKIKEIDTRSLVEAYELQVRNRAKREHQTIDEEELRGKVKQRLIQIKEHLASNAETKAQLRVVRALLGIKPGAYTKAELEKPFVVPRLVVRPEFLDPKDVIAAGARAVGELYGSGAGEKDAPASAAALPEGSPAQHAPSSSTRQEGSAGGNGSGASATGRRESRGGTSAATSPAADARSTKSEADAPEPTPGDRDDRPKVDTVVPEGEFKGKKFSELAWDHPDYLRAIASNHRQKAIRENAQDWLDFHLGKQQTLT